MCIHDLFTICIMLFVELVINHYVYYPFYNIITCILIFSFVAIYIVKIWLFLYILGK